MRTLKTLKNKAIRFLIIVSAFLFLLNACLLQKKELTLKFYKGINILETITLNRKKTTPIVREVEGKKFGMIDLTDNSYTSIQGFEQYENIVNDIYSGDADNDGEIELVAITDLELMLFEKINATWIVPQEKKIALYKANSFGKTSVRNFAEETRPARPLVLNDEEKKAKRILVADVNNDDKNEIILLKNVGGFEIFQFIGVDILAWENDKYVGLINFVIPGTGEQGVEVLDIDRDGKNEFVIATYNTIEIYQYNIDQNDFADKATPIELAPAIGDQRMTMGYLDGQLILLHCILNINGDYPDNEVGKVKKYILNTQQFGKMRNANYIPPMKLDYDKYRTIYGRNVSAFRFICQ